MNTAIATACCPYCGELIELVIDCSVPEQQYIEDCSVCCRPIVVNAMCDGEDELISLHLAHENE